MTTISQPIIQSQDAPIVQTSLYTSTAAKTAIDKLTATNITAGALTISVNLVPSGGTVGTGNLVSKAVSIAGGAVYAFPELIGHVLAEGDFISVIASATGLTIRGAGRVTTS